MTYAYLDDLDLALQWLERASKQTDFSLPREIAGEPLFKGLASDPRYQAFFHTRKQPVATGAFGSTCVGQ
jgi:hypothetical protein